MSGSEGSQDDDLEASARKHNSVLQGSIDVLGGLLAASRALLARLQGNAPNEPSSGHGAAPDRDGPPAQSGDKPPDAPQKLASPRRCRPVCI